MEKKRALVVGGGGSKGAYGVGIVEYYKSIGINYDIFVGSSTGALIVSLLAADMLDELITSYTTITNKDIFKICPFKIKSSKNGIYKYSINTWGAFYNIFIKKNMSLGDTSNLRYKTLPKFFSKETFQKIIKENKDLNIAVSNLTLERSEIKSIFDFEYERFCDWIWASTCAPPFMSIPEIDNYQYVDAGILNQVPIDTAIRKGADIIDVIILEKEFPEIANIEKVRNILHLIIKLEFAMMNRIKKYNINLGNLTDIAKKDVIINFHYTEKKLTNNSLVFDKDLMLEWKDLGYKSAQLGMKKSYSINFEKRTYKLLN